MGSETAEKKRQQEKIENFRTIIDSAYILFDKKYTMHELETMPYKQLLDLIDREQEMMEKMKQNNNKRG